MKDRLFNHKRELLVFPHTIPLYSGCTATITDEGGHYRTVVAIEGVSAERGELLTVVALLAAIGELEEEVLSMREV